MPPPPPIQRAPKKKLLVEDDDIVDSPVVTKKPKQIPIDPSDTGNFNCYLNIIHTYLFHGLDR